MLLSVFQVPNSCGRFILFDHATKNLQNYYRFLVLQLTGKMMFYGFLAMLPREDFPHHLSDHLKKFLADPLSINLTTIALLPATILSPKNTANLHPATKL